MWQLVICATLTCGSPEMHPEPLTLAECQQVAVLTVGKRDGARGVCRSEDGESYWSTDWGWRYRTQVKG
jgi:hypothetical protein